MKRFAFLMVASVLLGAQFLAIPLGFAQLSAYRFILLLSVAALGYRLIIKDPILELSFGNRGSISPYQLVYVAWLMYATISVIWAESVSRWAVGMFFVGTGIFSILFITYFIREKEDIMKLFRIFFGMSILHHVSAWIESRSVNFPKTTFGNQNDLATMLLAGLFVALILFLNTEKPWVKLLLIPYFISGYLLIDITHSRANSLALLVGVATFIALKLLDYKMSRSIFNMFVFGAVIGVLGILFVPPFREGIEAVISWAVTGPVHPTTSNRYRINMILNGFYLLIQTYGLGVGAGNVEHFFVTNPYLPVNAPNMHNWFMDILAGYGVFIFSLYMMMYVFILRRLFAAYKFSTDKFIKNTSIALFSYVVAFIISSASSSSNIVIEWQWIFWGMIITFIQYVERYKPSEDPLEIKNQNVAQLYSREGL